MRVLLYCVGYCNVTVYCTIFNKRTLDGRLISAIMISLAAMMAFFNDENKSVQRGETHLKSGHVIECSVSEGQLVGFLRASMRDKTYKVVSFAGRLVTLVNIIH